MALVDRAAIRDVLRDGTGPSLRRRRWIAALACVGLADFAIISLYQMGVVRHMPAHQKRICAYCVTGGTLHFAMTGLAWPEVRRALDELKTRRRQRTSG